MKLDRVEAKMLFYLVSVNDSIFDYWTLTEAVPHIVILVFWIESIRDLYADGLVVPLFTASMPSGVLCVQQLVDGSVIVDTKVN